jgi:predicted ATPase/DNA-binding CsgD family transcriptional regulator
MPTKSPTPLDRATSHATLPQVRTSFIGRAREIEAVLSSLKASRLVSLIGPGGCGKTRLAHAVAVATESQFTDGVCWLELAKVNDPLFVPQTVARALNITEQPDSPLLEQLQEKLSSKELLLILDNCEHLLAACASLVEELLRSPKIKILVTSREPLAVEGEMRYSVPSLTLPTAKQPFAEIAQCDAVHLFVERARSVRSDFALTLENAETVADLCRHLDGLPLAIELASARVNVLSLQQLGERLEGRLDLLVSATRGVERHHTLRAAIGWSYGLLSKPEGLLLQRLSVFASSFTLEIIEATCAWGELESSDMLELLTSLINKSLVVAETLNTDKARYRLLETIKHYASERLELSETWTQTHDFYLSCYLEFAEACADKLYEAEQQRYISELESEHDNLQVALAWAHERRRTVEGLRLAVALTQFWDARGYVREGVTWFERLLKLPADVAAKLPLALHVNALTFASFLASFLHDATLTKTWAERAVALCETSGEEGKPLLPFALAGLDSAYRVTGDWETALGVLERAIELERASGNPANRTLGMNLFVSGMTEAALGHFEAAHLQLDEALKLAEAADDIYRVGFVHNALGDLARFEKRFANALPHYERSLSLLQKIDANRMLPNTERNFGYACLRTGDTVRAYTLFKKSLEAHYEHNNRSGILRGLLGFAALAASLGLGEASALLHGFVFNRTTPLVSLDSGDKADELDYDYFTARVHNQLPSEELETARSKGRNLTLEDAVTFALNLPVISQIAKKHSHDLTQCELEVLTLIAKGLANSEIASHLELSKRTVEKHIANILSKLDLKSRAQLVRWAIDQNVIINTSNQ